MRLKSAPSHTGLRENPMLQSRFVGEVSGCSNRIAVRKFSSNERILENAEF